MRSRTAVLMLALAGCSAELEVSDQARPIVNGEATTDFPTTGILLSGSSPASLLCSGTLIGCDMFLTAGHCVCFGDGDSCQSTTPDDTLRVYLQNVGIVSVERRHVHPGYSFPDNDVAVLELARPVAGVRPTPLASAEVTLGTTGTIVGFGRSGGNLDDYGIKQFGDIVTDDCPAAADGPGHLCWHYQGEGANTCNGDSGGPLFVDQGGTVAVAGITSGGTRGDCLDGDRSYDTDVFTFVDYIVASSGGAGRLGQQTCGEVPHLGQEGSTVVADQGRIDSGALVPLEFEVPAGTSEVRVTFNATDGADVDLRIRQGEAPTATEHDCEAVGPSSYGFCGVDAPAPGTWHAALSAKDTADYQLTVTTLGGAPIALDDAYAASADTALEIAAGEGVLINDEPSARGPLSAEIETEPEHGTLALAPDGSFSYTPEAGYIGADRFTYRASDGTQATAAVVALTISAGGDEEEDEGGCGCATDGGGGGWPGALLLLALVATRFRACPRPSSPRSSAARSRATRCTRISTSSPSST
jgi:MYXO-CTERM domain-containing protein